jgi:hypothetical protein
MKNKNKIKKSNLTPVTSFDLIPFPLDSEIDAMPNSTVYIRDSDEIKMIYPDIDGKYHILFADGREVTNISTLVAKKYACIANNNIIRGSTEE